MVLEIDAGLFIGSVITISIAAIGAWWALGKMLISQFEKRQDERFASLTDSLTARKAEHDLVRAEVRRVESDLHRWMVEIAGQYQTKAETSQQVASIITEIRALASRIDQIHLRPAPASQ